MRIVHRRLLLFLLLTQVAQSQSRTHKIVCDGSGRGACDLFNQAVEDNDKHLSDAANHDHMIVCFRPKSNAFLLLSYDSPRETLWQEKDGGGYRQSGNADFLRFINGSANFGGESVFAVGEWVSTSHGDEHVSRFQGTSLVPGDVGRIEVDTSRIHVFHSFIQSFNDLRLPKTEYEFVLSISTNEFVETSRPSGSAATPILVTGKCVTYK